MTNLVNQNNNEVIDVETVLQNYEQKANRLTMINDHMYHQVGLYNRNISNLENSNSRYWNAQANFNQIMDNEENKYDYFKSKEQSILYDINKHNQPIRLWRFRDKFYYRPSQYGELKICDEKELAKEISSRYSNLNVQIVNDLNDALSYKKMVIRIDTTYIAINSIPVVDEEVFDISQMYEIFVNQQGYLFRNCFTYTFYLSKRFFEFKLDKNSFSEARYFIQSMATLKDGRFLVSSFGKFFKYLIPSSAIVLMGNKDVSEDILLKKILKPIFGSQFFITITDKILQTMSAEEIVKNKLIYHIDHIPADENHREKLREILISILVYKFIQVDNNTIPIHGQVIFTIEKEDIFFKDFLSSSDVFFVDSLDNIMSQLQIDDKFSFYKKLHTSLDIFAEELSVIGNMPFLKKEDDTNNTKFAKLINGMEEEINNLSEQSNYLSVLDPFDNSFESLIPTHERFKHMYITGQSGSGKSEAMKSIIYSDILRNDGVVIVLEPHGDLAKDIAKLPIDKNRLIYLDPTLQDGLTPTLNLFDLKDKSERNIQKVAKVIVSVVKGVNDNEKFSGVMEEMLYYCCCLLLRKGDSDFFELLHMLNDKNNKELVKLGKDSPSRLEKDYFEYYFKGSKQTQEAVKRRVSKILNDLVLSNLLNGKSTIDLEDAMNTQGNVIIFRIQKNEMLDSYIYYARFIIGLIQIIALKRASIEENDRVKTYCHIDEFHNFITPTIEEILTESRKYRLYLTLAHQATSQIKNSSFRDIILSNTNIKLIGNNKNKTLEAMNKTLNTKLEDVENLEVGEFYLSVGKKNIIKVNNTNKLLNGQKDITDTQWNEIKQYQLENYYRSTESIDNVIFDMADLNQKIDTFINAIKSIDIAYFDNVKNDAVVYKELIYNFNDNSRNALGYISKQDLYLYFNLVYEKTYFNNNIELLKLIKKDTFFKQDVNTNKTYNSKKRLVIT
jgi:hypothetical protein